MRLDDMNHIGVVIHNLSPKIFNVISKEMHEPFNKVEQINILVARRLSRSQI